MAESWSNETKDLLIKANIIHECAFLPEFFPEFPDKSNLSDKELNNYFKVFFNIIKHKAKSAYTSIREINILLAFFTIYWKKYNSADSPKMRIYGTCYQCMDYFKKAPKERKKSILKKYNVFFHAFFTRERISKLTKYYKDKQLEDILKKNYELN